MIELATHLFREVSIDFFRVLATPHASLYIDVLDALDREAAQSNQGLDRDEALALIQQLVEQHVEIAQLEDEDPAVVATSTGRARSILETLRRAGWLHEEERSNWQRLIHFEPNGTLLLQTLRKIAYPETRPERPGDAHCGAEQFLLSTSEVQKGASELSPQQHWLGAEWCISW